MSSTTLVTVVHGSAYEAYSDALFDSAEHFFHPTKTVKFLMLQGRPGWPDATMYRWHALASHLPNSTYVFLSDADMRFESEVRSEVLPRQGIVATLHPGYVISPTGDLPYERRPTSVCCISGRGGSYFCGGFVGGTRQAMLQLAHRIADKIDTDVEHGIIPRWHDESALNRCLLELPPSLILSPSYCYPDDDSWYRSYWSENYERKLVAIDKTAEERGGRG